MRFSFNSKRFIGFFFFLLFSFLLSAQDKKIWSLKDCIDYALMHNLQVKQQLLNVRITKEELIRSQAGLLPSLNGYASHGYNFGRAVDPFSNDFTNENVSTSSLSLSGNLNVFEGLRGQNTIKQNRFAFLASEAETDRLRDDISLAIANSYLQVVFSEELLTVARNQKEVINQQLERTKKIVDAGGLAKGNQLDLEAQAALEELNAVNAENQLFLSYLQLKQLLDLDSVSDFKIAKPDVNEPDGALLLLSPDEVFKLALATRPDVKSADLSVKSAMKGLAASRGMKSPSLSMSGSLSSGYSSAREQINGFSISGIDTIGYTLPGFESVVAPTYSYLTKPTPFNDQLNENFSKSLRLNLSIPIFNGWQVRTAVTRARIEVERAQNNKAIIKNQLYKLIQQSYADARASMLKYNASKKATGAMQEAFKYTEQRFNVGMATTIEYNDSHTKLTKTQSDLLQAKYDYVFKTKVLEFYQGKAIY